MYHRNKTHTNRWHNPKAYSEKWFDRSSELLKLFLKYEYIKERPYVLAEFGCGVNAPFAHVCGEYENLQVNKFDIKRWDEQTTLMDLNAPELILPKVDVSVFSGVLEYLNNIDDVLSHAIKVSNFILLSYAFFPRKKLDIDTDYLEALAQRTNINGWRNHFSIQQFVEILLRHGTISGVNTWNGNQALFLLRNFSINTN